MRKINLSEVSFSEELMEQFVNGKAKGTINLSVPVVNINEWYSKKTCPYALALGITQDEFEKIIYYARHVIFDKENRAFRIVDEKQLLDEKADKNDVDSMMGAKAIKRMVESLKMEDFTAMEKSFRETERECMAKLELLNKEISEKFGDTEYDMEFVDNNEEIELTEEQKECAKKVEEKKKYSSELYHARMGLDAIWYVRKYGTSRLIIDKLSFFSLETRMALSEEADAMPYSVYHDLHRLCERVVFRNSRCEKLFKMGCPDIIMRNESRMLQEYVDTMICNGKRGRPVTHDDADGHILSSLTDIIMRNKKI